MNFNKFLTDNHLKKSEIALFLGVSNAFITQLCSGARKLPNDKLALIIGKKEWDSSALSETGNIAVAVNGSTAHIGHNDSIGNVAGTELAVLRKEIEMLNHIIEEKDKQIEFLKTLISK